MNYTPLHDPENAAVTPRPVNSELSLARNFLAEVAAANIHDSAAMIEAAAGLHYRLQSLVTALDAERGGA